MGYNSEDAKHEKAKCDESLVCLTENSIYHIK